MDEHFEEKPLLDREIEYSPCLVVTDILGEGGEATGTFMTRAEMVSVVFNYLMVIAAIDSTDEHKFEIGLQRVRRCAEARVRKFIRDRSISGVRVEELREMVERERERRYGVKNDGPSLGVAVR